MNIWVCGAAALSFFALGFAGTAAAGDCPPLGHLPQYKADGDNNVVLRAYDHYDFKVTKGDEDKTVTVSGKACTASYSVKEGVDPLSDLEIQTNYRDQLQKLGAQITAQDDRDTYAKLVKGGMETWLYVYSQESSIEIHVVTKTDVKQTLTSSDPKIDYRLLGHMPNYKSDGVTKKNFDKFTFKVQNGDETKDVDATGAYYQYTYSVKDGAQTASDSEIQANYRSALKSLGAQILWQDDRDTTARLENKGQSIWVYVYSQESSIEIDAIEEKALLLSIQPPQASAMKAALDKAGHIALYINFDFNKATLRPDATPIVAQIVTLLKTNPALKVSLQGHTDNIGGHDYNVKLSKDRAAAVAAAVAKAGIDPKRLSSGGFGPDKPVADNNTADGRAKNRRVELVKQ